jgi:hypothetical protein
VRLLLPSVLPTVQGCRSADDGGCASFEHPFDTPLSELGCECGRPEDDDSPPVVGSGEKKSRGRHEALEGNRDTGLSTAHAAFDLDASCSGG